MDLNMSRGQLEQNKEQHTHAASQRDLADAHISSKKSKVVIDGDGSSTVVGSKWSEYSEEASDNEAHPNGEDHRVDKHNRIVIEDSNISVPTECQPAKRPRHRAPSALHAPRRKVSNNTNTHAEHSKLHNPSDFAVSSTDSEGALSQALALVRRQNQSVRSITAASTPLSCTIGTATANISKGQSSVVKSPSPSRWDSYVSEPDSGSDD
ncbi:hypothetical protein H4R24_004420 [Coemansia sp. RSA 988]|nr:hypothetical protein H4R24_004420 [Coemansia sp. RSA 988]